MFDAVIRCRRFSGNMLCWISSFCVFCQSCPDQSGSYVTPFWYPEITQRSPPRTGHRIGPGEMTIAFSGQKKKKKRPKKKKNKHVIFQWRNVPGLWAQPWTCGPRFLTHHPDEQWVRGKQKCCCPEREQVRWPCGGGVMACAGSR